MAGILVWTRIDSIVPDIIGRISRPTKNTMARRIPAYFMKLSDTRIDCW
mgnify:CR=1 FL=1